MKIEYQVCSLELAKKLKELGVKQESLFWWFESKDKKETLLCFDAKLPNEYIYDFEKNYSAYTCSELGEMLPDAVASYRYRTEPDEDPNIWACIKYVEGEHSKYDWVCHAPTEADARAKMLIYLLENKFLTLPQEKGKG